MGYRDDAFFRLPSTESNIAASNPDFAYPPKNIRFLDTQATVSKTNEGYALKRGYIRGLKLPNVAESVNFTSKKCNFQFNPSRILQSVSMKQDMYLPILQDPAQFTQPVGSMINFNFDLLFDRSEEVYRGVTTSSGVDRDVFDPTADFNNPNPTTDVADIGVLADLQVLYSVIGQGFSKDLLDYQKARLLSSARSQFINDNSSSTITEEELGSLNNSFDELISDERVSNNLDTFTNNINAGNAAFLIPFPVRVIFSSLFMVDGFVTGTTVDFLKFNTNMVPVQAKVNMSMQAVYIGFAKEKTLITEQLEKVQADIISTNEQTASTAEELKNALNTTGRSFKFSLTGEGDWDSSSESGASSIYYYTFNEERTGNDAIDSLVRGSRGFKVGFSNIGEGTPEEESETTTQNVDGTTAQTEVASTYDDKILKLIRAGGVSIEYEWSVDIFGPYETNIEAANALVNSSSLKENTLKHRGSYSNKEIATTDEQWGYNQRRGIRRQEHGAGSDGISAWNASPNINQAPTWETLIEGKTNYSEELSKYYVVVVGVEAIAKTTTSGYADVIYRASETGSYIRQGSGKILNATLQLSWS